jgi:5-methylcytosine-specific restriction endonuclease McrA
MSKSAIKVRAMRLHILECLGNKCASCACVAALQMDLIVSDGGAHHKLSWPDRTTFYLHQLIRGNLQLLCPTCHRRKTLIDVRSRRVSALTRVSVL